MTRCLQVRTDVGAGELAALLAGYASSHFVLLDKAGRPARVLSTAKAKRALERGDALPRVLSGGSADFETVNRATLLNTFFFDADADAERAPKPPGDSPTREERDNDHDGDDGGDDDDDDESFVVCTTEESCLIVKW